MGSDRWQLNRLISTACLPSFIVAAAGVGPATVGELMKVRKGSHAHGLRHGPISLPAMQAHIPHKLLTPDSRHRWTNRRPAKHRSVSIREGQHC